MPDLTQFFDNAPLNPFSVEPQDDFLIVTPGKYSALIEKAELKPNKKLTGHLISLQLQILDEGPFKGRKIFDNINIQNPSAECVRIGLRALRALVEAMGFQEEGEEWKDTDLYVNKVVVAHVKVKDEQNSVRTYSAAGDAFALPVTAPVPAVAPAPAPVAAPVAPQPVAYVPPNVTPAAAPALPTTDTRPIWER